MKILEMMSNDFLEEVKKLDPKMYTFFQETDINEGNKERIEKLRDDTHARANFLESLTVALESGTTLEEVLPKRFTAALREKDKHMHTLLSMAPSSQYSQKIKDAFQQESVQDLVLSWFDSRTANNVMARYKLLNLTMGDIVEDSLATEKNEVRFSP